MGSFTFDGLGKGQETIAAGMEITSGWHHISAYSEFRILGC